MPTNNTLPTFIELTSDQFAAAKAEGRWPLAHITMLRSDKPDINGAKRVYYVEIVSNVEAGWVTKGDPSKDIDTVELEDLKHAMWAGVEMFHQHSLSVMEHGLHLWDVDLSKNPEKVIGAVASWTTNTNFMKYAPADGWVEIRARNVGGGNIHYSAGDILNESAQTKYDYEDMLFSGTANFRLFVPPFLDTPRTMDDGRTTGTWIGSVIESLKMEREASIAHAKERAVISKINQTAYEGAHQAALRGNEVKAETLIVKGVDGIDIDLNSVSQRIYVYVKFGTKFTYLRSIPWTDHTAEAKNLVAKYRTNYFSLKMLE